MQQNISAAAISRIISHNTNVVKASTRNIWSRGFVSTGYGVEVQVTYQHTDRDVIRRNLDHIVEAINSREDRKYFAEKLSGESHGGAYVKVVIRDQTDPQQNEAERAGDVEKLAEEAPHAVTVEEVRAVLAGRWFEYTESPQLAGGGYFVERLEGPRAGTVRVSYKDHPHTSYELVIGGREAYAVDAVERYAESLVQAGYSAWIDYQDTDGWSVLVGPDGHFAHQDKPEDVKEALTALREAVEANDLSFMTRRASDHSIFVYFLVPFKDKLRRVEVSWSNGSYSSIGQFGGSRSEFYSTELAVRFIRSEIAE